MCFIKLKRHNSFCSLNKPFKKAIFLINIKTSNLNFYNFVLKQTINYKCYTIALNLKIECQKLYIIRVRN